MSSYPFISYNDDCSFSAISHHYFQTRNIEPQSTITDGGSDDMIKQAVLNNVGYAILGADILKDELREEDITILEKVNEPIVTSSIHLKVRADETNIRTFTAFLQKEWLTAQEKLFV
ncbi:LysR family transcriptional regulator substrate-binding protein [Priestia koreensis]|uniref:LysR family transcriptional regulator substrate-binding protein n=1 Tax=Priestia koreensis TaxID=284581 RepID=UPI003459A952